MLKKLTILNGELSLKFDPLNTRYTVNMTSSAERLELEYEIDSDDQISIFNNNLVDDKEEVVITVYNDEEMMSYYLEVYKMESDEVSDFEDYFASLELKSDTKMPSYVAPSIASGCFLLILIIFSILFKRAKR